MNNGPFNSFLLGRKITAKELSEANILTGREGKPLSKTAISGFNTGLTAFESHHLEELDKKYNLTVAERESLSSLLEIKSSKITKNLIMNNITSDELEKSAKIVKENFNGKVSSSGLMDIINLIRTEK